MKCIRIVTVLATLACATTTLQGDEAESTVPYNRINLLLKAVEGKKLDGVDCAPLYLKSAREGEQIDVKEANFRIRTWDGDEEHMKVAILSQVPAKELTLKDEMMIKDGFTHILWVPRGAKRFLDGELVASLPKGAITFSQFIGISGSIRTEAGGKAKNRARHQE